MSLKMSVKKFSQKLKRYAQFELLYTCTITHREVDRLCSPSQMVVLLKQNAMKGYLGSGHNSNEIAV